MAKPKKFGRGRHRPPGEWVQTTLAEEVFGLKHREANARAFAAAVEKAERAGQRYGVALALQPDNPHDRYAIAVFGQCMVKPFLRTPKLREWHIGFVERELARELHDDLLSRGIPISSELYSIYKSGKYLEINYIVLAPPGYGHSARTRSDRSK